MEVIWEASPNFGPGRNGRKVITIVDHITAGEFPGCLSWMQNPLSKVSAHYLITRAGAIIQMVREADRAYHAGIVDRLDWDLYDGFNPNNSTIGIEHEGAAGDGLTEPQYQSSLWLHQELSKKYEIPIDSDHIIGHSRINKDHDCPGTGFPWDRLFQDLKEESDILKVAVLLNTKDDFWAGVDVAEKNGDCAIFLRPSDEAKKAETLIVVGGASVRASNEILLSGTDKFDTAAEVKKYLGR